MLFYIIIYYFNFEQNSSRLLSPAALSRAAGETRQRKWGRVRTVRGYQNRNQNWNCRWRPTCATSASPSFLSESVKEEGGAAGSFGLRSLSTIHPSVRRLLLAPTTTRCSENKSRYRDNKTSESATKKRRKGEKEGGNQGSSEHIRFSRTLKIIRRRDGKSGAPGWLFRS